MCLGKEKMRKSAGQLDICSMMAYRYAFQLAVVEEAKVTQVQEADEVCVQVQ
jgi:hypothetical protein